MSVQDKVENKLRGCLVGARYFGYMPVELLQSPTSESNSDSDTSPEQRSSSSNKWAKSGHFVVANIAVGILAMLFFGIVLHRRGMDLTTSDTILWGLAGGCLGYVTILKLVRLINGGKVAQFWTTTVAVYQALEEAGCGLENFSAVNQELQRIHGLYASVGGLTVLIQSILCLSNLLNQDITLLSFSEDAFGILFIILWTGHLIGFQAYIVGYLKMLRAGYEAVETKIQLDLHVYLNSEPGRVPAPDVRATVSVLRALEDYLGVMSSGYGYFLIVELSTVTLCGLGGLFTMYTAMNDYSGDLQSVAGIVIAIFNATINFYALYTLCHEGDRITCVSSSASTATVRVAEVGLGLWRTEVNDYLVAIARNLKPASLNCGGYFEIDKGLFIKILGYVSPMMGIFISIYRAQAYSLDSLLKQ